MPYSQCITGVLQNRVSGDNSKSTRYDAVQQHRHSQSKKWGVLAPKIPPASAPLLVILAFILIPFTRQTLEKICSFICYNWAEFWFTDQRYQHHDFNKLKEMLKPYKKASYILQRHWNPDPSVLDIPRINQWAERSIEVMLELYYMCKNKDELQLRFILSKKHELYKGFNALFDYFCMV